MTDRQFDAYHRLLLLTLKSALAESPSNTRLKELIEDIEEHLNKPYPTAEV